MSEKLRQDEAALHAHPPHASRHCAILTRFNAGPAVYRRPGRAADRDLISCRLVRMEHRRWTVLQPITPNRGFSLR